MKKIHKYPMLILLIMFCINMGNLEKYIFLALLCVYLCSCRFILNFSKNSSYIFLELWGISYYLMWLLDGNSLITGIIYYIIGPFIIGKCCERMISENSTNDIKTNFNNLLIIVSLGFFIHGAIDTIYSIFNNVFIYNSELVYDVITGGKINRTIVGMYLTPIVCVAVPILFLGKNYIERKLRVLVTICAITAVLLSIYLGNRTLLIITVLEVFFCYLFGLRTKVKKRNFILIPTVGIALGSILWSENFADIQNYFAESFLMSRITNNQLGISRIDIYKQVLTNLDDYIFGWISAGGTDVGISLSYAHNLWIDCLIYAGIVPFIFLILYTVSILKSTFRLFKSIDSALTQTITVCFVFGLMLNWCVEPILYADPYYFAVICGCFLCIDTVRYTIKERQKNYDCTN